MKNFTIKPTPRFSKLTDTFLRKTLIVASAAFIVTGVAAMGVSIRIGNKEAVTAASANAEAKKQRLALQSQAQTAVQPAVTSESGQSTTAQAEGAVSLSGEPVTGTSTTSGTAAGSGSNLQNQKLYVDPSYAAMGRPWQIASQPTARWFGGWNADVQADANGLVSAAAAQGALATLVAYNIPARDCGSYSAGGASGSDAYRSWIRQFAAGIGQRPAIVILEPDALPGMDCLSSDAQSGRLANIADAVSVLASQTKAFVYIDAGNYSWQSADTMASRLSKANIAQATGFSLNVSGYGWTSSSVNYGNTLSGKLGGKHFVIDTSRNGNGPTWDNQWCNPRGRALGERPTVSPVGSSAYAYLWLKVPGESDGTCNGGPAAGQWWPEIASELIANARW